VFSGFLDKIPNTSFAYKSSHWYGKEE